jgi:hypothetical protein
MAREPERKTEMEERTIRCLDEDGRIFTVTAAVEYVRHEINLPGGGSEFTDWKEGKARAECPNSPFHRIEPVEE